VSTQDGLRSVDDDDDRSVQEPVEHGGGYLDVDLEKAV
jgi:hypothetical protein